MTGYLVALLIGITLGMLGGGGSVLTVPLLVYCMHIPPVTATAYSLVIVGLSAVTGAFMNLGESRISAAVVIQFGLSSVITVFCIRRFIAGLISGYITMSLLAVVMILTGMVMLKNRNRVHAPAWRVPLVIPGILAGLIAGFLGAGGGFILIPALTIACGLAIREAIATSLVIISLNAAAGFIADFTRVEFDWYMLSSVTAVPLVGTVAGTIIGRNADSKKLRLVFSCFMIAVALVILVKEISFGTVQ